MTFLAPWIWRSLPLNERTGSEVFAAGFLNHEIATLLESPYPASSDYPQLGRFSICAGAPCQVWTPSIGEILPFLSDLIQQQSNSAEPEHLPFTGGWLGWLGYDLAWEIEKLPHLKDDKLPFPVAFWYEPDCFAVLDHEQQTLWLAARSEAQLDQLEQSTQQANQSNRGKTPQTGAAFQTEFCMSQTEYEAIVLKAKQHIQAGDIFQANLSLRFEAKTTAESWSIYRALQSINPSPFSSYWKTPWGDVISCSPERLVKLSDRIAETRPIAGTRPRGLSIEQDHQFEQDLLDNTKERAEHIMLVDLERNDLGRVCEWGTVEVDELLVIERYSHVMHLVSNVVGTVRSQFTPIDVIRALFPGGTITGCPKVRCMEIVEALEPVRRSLFYGSCGFLDRRGNLDLNILIRTLLYAKSGEVATVWGQVGAGIVADSDPEKEWFESLQKARAQLAALGH
ncbi:anthranilate synthase component I [Leptolyngbya boryana CZ1]|uniref:Anthranilate synthase component 1 n=1 Tax=Leptolyngbya boryana CZ1 TaxID=3060204 RepID=A0AA96X1H2_LEPBY|nr:anthranilate synthase component I [Leptolyngbya boryana]WNZ48104.1 anthranilate synthase component I [Leptolyngbya boryana CZ1]